MLKININDYFSENKNKSDYIGIFDPLNILLDVIGKTKQDLIEQSNFIPGANNGKESLEEFSGTYETHLKLNTKIDMCSEFEDLIMDIKRQIEWRSEMYGKCLYTCVLNVRNREMGNRKGDITEDKIQELNRIRKEIKEKEQELNELRVKFDNLHSCCIVLKNNVGVTKNI